MATTTPIAPIDPVDPPNQPEFPPWQAPVEEPAPQSPELAPVPPDRDFPEQTPGELPVPDSRGGAHAPVAATA